MFDDIIEPENKNSEFSTPGNGVPAQSAVNNIVNNAVPASDAKAGYPEDMFAEASPEEKPAALQPKVNAIQIGPLEQDNKDMKKLLVLSGLLLSFVLFCLGGYWAYGYFTDSKENEVVDMGGESPLSEEQIVENIPKEDDESVQDMAQTGADQIDDLDQPRIDNQSDLSATSSPEQGVAGGDGIIKPLGDSQSDGVEQITSTTEGSVALDTDQDGLTDEVEAGLGTNVSSVDSDHDGLFDLEEVVTYKTDPLNPDTDSDTYLDGAEVKAGYNPKGSGRL